MVLCLQVTRALEAKIERLTEEGKGFKLQAEGQVTLQQLPNIAPGRICVTCLHTLQLHQICHTC